MYKQLELPLKQKNNTGDTKDIRKTIQSEKLGKKATFFAMAFLASAVISGLCCSIYDITHSTKRYSNSSTASNSSICFFNGFEFNFKQKIEGTSDLELYLQRLPYSINLENPFVLEVLAQSDFYLSTVPLGYSENSGNTTVLGLWSYDDKKITLFNESLYYHSKENVAVHEFLHAIYSNFEESKREELDSMLLYLKWLTTQFENNSIAILEEKMGKLNPMEILFFQNLKNLLNKYSDASHCTEMYANFGEDIDIGIPLPILGFYNDILSEQYLSNHLSNPKIRFDEIFFEYFKRKQCL